MLRPLPVRRTVVLTTTVAALAIAGCGDRPIHPFGNAPDSGVVSGECSTDLLGYATMNGGTTGGQGGDVVTVATLDDLQMYAAMDGPLVIRVEGTIVGTGQIEIASNKTIEGIGGGTLLSGVGLKVQDATNVIIRNLSITKVLAEDSQGYDAITIENGQQVWVDHCDLSTDLVAANPEIYDSLIDIKVASDFVTVSWTRFHDHIFDVSFIGHSNDTGDVDSPHLHVTFHHNLFQNTPSTNSPSLRFGVLHAFNNHYVNVGQGIVSRMNGRTLAEFNVFSMVVYAPLTTLSESPAQGFIEGELTNKFENSGPRTITQTMPITMPYSYAGATNPIEKVPVVVDPCVGPGHI